MMSTVVGMVMQAMTPLFSCVPTEADQLFARPSIQLS